MFIVCARIQEFRIYEKCSNEWMNERTDTEKFSFQVFPFSYINIIKTTNISVWSMSRMGEMEFCVHEHISSSIGNNTISITYNGVQDMEEFYALRREKKKKLNVFSTAER